VWNVVSLRVLTRKNKFEMGSPGRGCLCIQLRRGAIKRATPLLANDASSDNIEGVVRNECTCEVGVVRNAVGTGMRVLESLCWPPLRWANKPSQLVVHL